MWYDNENILDISTPRIYIVQIWKFIVNKSLLKIPFVQHVRVQIIFTTFWRAHGSKQMMRHKALFKKANGVQ